MYDIPKEEPTHEAVTGTLSHQSRTETFFKAASTGDLETVSLFINHIPGSQSWVDEEGKVVLHHAVINKRKDVCKLLLEERIPSDVNTQDKAGRTPLRYAAANEDKELIQFLITNGANPDITNSAGNTVLGFAASRGYTPICRILLEEGKANPNTANNYGHTPLHHASSKGHEMTCKLLLEFGANQNATSHENSTPLHSASAHDHASICQLLLAANADPNVQLAVENSDKDGFTPLHIATSSGNYSICKILLDGGADPNIKAKHGRTSLATAHERKSIFKLLLEYKADPNLTNSEGRTLLHHACEQGDVEMCTLLLDGNVNVNVQDKMGLTALHIAFMNRGSIFLWAIVDLKSIIPLRPAAKENSYLLCKMLLNSKADPNLKDYLGKSPLHYAAISKHVSVESSQLLLDNGADPNLADTSGNTPLHSAVKQQPEDIKVQIFLVERGADLTITNKNGQKPKQLSTWGKDEDFLIQKAVQRREYNNLLSKGNKPLEVVKLFFCGDPKAGKTTLKNSLTKQPLLNFYYRTRMKTTKSADNAHGDEKWYDCTPGIDVTKGKVPNCGIFSMWDCAGQLEYHVTHGMFMGVDNAIFTVTYDVHKSLQNTKTSWKFLNYWLSFIKAGHNPQQKSKPNVVLVASHLDECQDKTKAYRNAEELLKIAQKRFSRHLNIRSELVVIDTRLPSGVGMDTLRETLRSNSETIKGTKIVPTLCDKIKTKMKSWCHKDYPVLPWSEYVERVKDEIDPLVKEDFLMVATSYLHDMGEVYYAQLPDREHQIVLDTKWFSYDIIGAAFAREDFPAAFEKLPERRLYNRNELKDFFKTSADSDLLVALLQHVGLLYKCGKDKYIIPGKLPESLDKVSWRKEDEFREYHGRRIECKQDIDIFAPDVFPCIQTRIMEEFDMLDDAAAISRSTLKFAVDSVEGMLQLTEDKRAINIACRCRGEEDRSHCQQMLERVARLIKLELLKRSPGTETELFYLSPRSLCQHDDLEDIWYYSEDDLKKGEQNSRGSVKHSATGNTDKISAILCLGHDSMFLDLFGLNCSIQWVLQDFKLALYRCLDVTNQKRDDYRSLAEVLDISEAEVHQVQQQSPVSVTEEIINKYCTRERRKMTIGKLRDILSHPGLVDNSEALKILDDMLAENGIQVPQKISSISTNMPIKQMAWRATLRQCWDSLRADIKPSDLLHPFLSEDDEERILAEERSNGPRKANDALLSCLLQRQGWYDDFMISLRGKSAGVGHLADLLEKTYLQVWETLPMLKLLREMYLLAWNRVMKNQWVMFRTTVVPHTLLPHLPFLSEENKESILDIEEELGNSSAADILHNIIRDTNDPTYFRSLMLGLRANGFTELADRLYDDFTKVLQEDDFKYLRVHQSEDLFPL